MNRLYLTQKFQLAVRRKESEPEGTSGRYLQRS